jgi:hypothetical protein
MGRIFALLVSSSFAATLLPGNAQAASILGGTTDVTVTAAQAITDLGLSFAPLGSATVTFNGSGLPVVSFPITGGTLASNGDAIIEHDGSGLSFTAGSNTLLLENFTINTASSSLFGLATANGSAVGIVPLFNITPSLGLTLTSQAAGALSAVFGAPDLTGVEIGTAAVNPVTAPVPEPANWLMLISGFALLGASIRGTRRQSVAYA